MKICGKKKYIYIALLWVFGFCEIINAQRQQLTPPVLSQHAELLKPVELAEFIALFLLPSIAPQQREWAEEIDLPIFWKTQNPVQTPAHLRSEGALYREGDVVIAIQNTITHYYTTEAGDPTPGTWHVRLLGNKEKVTKVRLETPGLIVDFPSIQAAVEDTAIDLIPYHCDTARSTFDSNVVYEVQMKGKAKAWLDEDWFCKPMGRKAGWCRVGLMLIYAQEDADMIECRGLPPTPVPETEPAIQAFRGRFPDPHFQQLILDLAKQRNWTSPDQVTRLSISPVSSKITHLDGIEDFRNLEHLSIHYQHELTDISPLHALTKLTTLSLIHNNIVDIEPLQHLTNLQDLILRENRITDFSGVMTLTALKTLDLENNQVTDISALQYLTDLQTANLSNNHISDLPPLGHLVKLTTLNLVGNHIVDLSALADIPNLQVLHISSNRISDISPLSGLLTLQGLSLAGNPITDLSALSSLKNLQTLGLSGDSIANVSALAQLTNLQSLYLGRSRISDISWLSYLTKLTSLSLQDNAIVDISALAQCQNLERLELARNSIVNISALDHLKQLRYLDLTQNKIVDISALGNLRQLKSLRLGHNNITDISALSHLNQLESLDLVRNNITDISPLSHLKALTRLHLEENPITNIEPLFNLSKLEDLPFDRKRKFPCEDIDKLWKTIQWWDEVVPEKPACLSKK